MNQSWRERGIRQICKLDIVEIGNNWTHYTWPAEVAVGDKNNEKKGFCHNIQIAKFLYNNLLEFPNVCLQNIEQTGATDIDQRLPTGENARHGSESKKSTDLEKRLSTVETMLEKMAVTVES